MLTVNQIYLEIDKSKFNETNGCLKLIWQSLRSYKMVWKILMLIDQNGAFPHAPFFLRHAVYTLHNETLLVHSISYTIRIIRNDGIEPAKKNYLFTICT